MCIDLRFAGPACDPCRMQLLLLILAVVVVLAILPLAVAALKVLWVIALIVLALGIANYFRDKRSTPTR